MSISTFWLHLSSTFPNSLFSPTILCWSLKHLTDRLSVWFLLPVCLFHYRPTCVGLWTVLLYSSESPSCCVSLFISGLGLWQFNALKELFNETEKRPIKMRKVIYSKTLSNKTSQHLQTTTNATTGNQTLICGTEEFQKQTMKPSKKILK